MADRVIKMTGRGLRGESYGDILRRSGLFGILPTDDDATAIGKLNADAAASAAFAEAFAGPVYANQAAGEAATTEGEVFRVSNGDGPPETLTAYRRTSGGSVELAPLATTAALDSTSGAGMVGATGTTIATRAAMSALAGAANYARPLQLTEGLPRLFGRMGMFVFDPSDCSAGVTADPEQGVYVAPDSDGTGASGAWVRQFNGAILPQWFGALGDGSTDDAAAIQAAIDFAVALKKDIWFPAAHYVVETTLLKGQSFYCPNFYAEAGAILDGTAIANGATLKIKGGSGQFAGAVIVGFRFRAGSGENSTGLEIADQCGVEYESCIFETGTWGVTYHNEGVGGFTEYCVGRRCTFLEALTDAAVRYRVTSGNNSFHGSGLTDHCTIQLEGADNAIKIETGAMVYNAPLSFQVWVTGSSKVVVNNASTERQATIGPITIEVFGAEPYATAPELFGGSGSVVTHSGDVVSFGTSWLGPKCRLIGGARTVFIGPEGGAANGSTAYKQAPYTLLKELSDDAGGTVIFNLSDVAFADVVVQIEAPNYDYRYRLSLGTGLFGAGNVEEINNPVAFNSSAAGPPTFEVDSDGDFIITNTNYDDTYTAFVTVHPMGPARAAVLSSGADYKPS